MKNIIYILLFTLGISIQMLEADEMQDRLALAGKMINENSSFLPATLVLDGKSYIFDQSYLLDSLTGSLNSYDSAFNELNSSKSGSSEYKIAESGLIIAKASLAYGIMAAGQYAVESHELSSVLLAVEDKLKKEILPASVASPFYQIVGIASQAFKDKQGEAPDVDVENLGPRDFESLILVARMQIAARSKTSDK